MRKFIFLSCIALMSVTMANASVSISPPQVKEYSFTQPIVDLVYTESVQTQITMVALAPEKQKQNLLFTRNIDRPISRFGFTYKNIDYEDSPGFIYKSKLTSNFETVSRYLMGKPSVRFLSCSSFL